MRPFTTLCLEGFGGGGGGVLLSHNRNGHCRTENETRFI